MLNGSEFEGDEDVRSDDPASLTLSAITKQAQANRKKAAAVRAQYCLTDTQVRELTALTESHLETGGSKWMDVHIQVCGDRHTAATVLAMEILMSTRGRPHSNLLTHELLVNRVSVKLAAHPDFHCKHSGRRVSFATNLYVDILPFRPACFQMRLGERCEPPDLGIGETILSANSGGFLSVRLSLFGDCR
jgi:hypothetical protein